MSYLVKIYGFSNAGKALANRISEIKVQSFRGEKLEFIFDEKDLVDEETYKAYSAHLFIGACGIAVRKIAPYINSKYSDPAVVVIDEKGEFVIPILSGHIGGANALATLLADSLDAKAVITTSSDVNGYNAIDKIASDSRLTYYPIDCVRKLNKKIVNGERIKVFLGDDIEVTKDSDSVYEISSREESDVSIENISKYIIGIGCRKNIDSELFRQTVDDIISSFGISHKEIDRIASIDLKKDEKAVLEYAGNNGVMYEVYTADELASVAGDFDNSDFVKEITGVSNVSERAAAYAGSLMGKGAFILKREARNGITVSIYKVVKRVDLNGKA